MYGANKTQVPGRALHSSRRRRTWPIFYCWSTHHSGASTPTNQSLRSTSSLRSPHMAGWKRPSLLKNVDFLFVKSDTVSQALYRHNSFTTTPLQINEHSTKPISGRPMISSGMEKLLISLERPLEKTRPLSLHTSCLLAK